MVGVVLAAGRGERLGPLTDGRPKALCTVGGVALVDLAIERLLPSVDAVAVNTHYLHEQLVAHLAGRPVHVAVEQPEALGTAGALGNLREWVDGRDVIVTNCDAWYCDTPPSVAPPPSAPAERIRLLAVERSEPADFGPWLYAGTAFMPWTAVRALQPVPSGLYEVCWRDAWVANKLDLVPYAGRYIDCGTPGDLAAADEAARA